MTAPSPSEPASSGPAPASRPPLFTGIAAAGVVALIAVALVSQRETQEPTPEVSQATPTPSDPLRPAFKHEVEPPQKVAPKPAKPRDLVRRAPVPVAEPAEAGDGGRLFQDALAQLPTPSHEARSQLQAVGLDFKAKLGPAGQRYLRDAWPSLQLLQRAARATAFSAPSVGQDLSAPRLLALAALAMGRMDLRSGATAKGLRWALYVVTLGRRWGAASAELLEVSQAVGVARLGEAWLEAALQHRPWSHAELTWLQARLAELPASPSPASAASPSEAASMHALYAKSLAAEREAFASVTSRTRGLLRTTQPTSGGTK